MLACLAATLASDSFDEAQLEGTNPVALPLLSVELGAHVGVLTVTLEVTE